MDEIASIYSLTLIEVSIEPQGAAAIDERSQEYVRSEGISVSAIPSNAEAQIELLDLPLDSPALRRLLNEVRGDDFDVPRSYNRTYNRHNR